MFRIPRCGSIRIILLLLLVVGSLILTALFWWPLPTRHEEANQVSQLLQGLDANSIDPVADDDAIRKRIEAFCGDCHAVPKPTSFPRYAWHKEVRAGYEFYSKSGRTDLDPPPIAETVAYFRRHAPQQLTFPDPREADRPLSVSFRTEKWRFEGAQQVAPAISHFNWLRLQPDAKPVLVVSDMRRGMVMSVDPSDAAAAPEILAQLKHPCHVEQCDLDGNGTLDLVVADLGSFPPGDHLLGRVVWLSGQPDGKTFKPVVIASGLGRVADARPADFDGDGDLDVIVAVFGMERSGGIVLLRNVAKPGETCRFEQEVLDPRPAESTCLPAI